MESLAVYVINMDGSDDRLQAITERLSSFGITFERVSAIDGRKLNLCEIEDYDEKRAELHMGRSLVGGEIGCYRSHLAAARRFVASEAQYALILEDDAFLDRNPLSLLHSILAYLDNADPEWVLINLGNVRLKIFTALSRHRSDNLEYQLAAAHYFPVTTHAIVWSRLGAQTFLQQNQAIFAPIDNYFRHWLTRSGHGYALSPALIATSGADSQITSNQNTARRHHKRKWFYAITKQYRLFTEKLIAMRCKKRFRSTYEKLAQADTA